jgi:hypothetical protein
MIKDTLLVCSITLTLVLLYRVYTVSQRVNNLEEKINILDNFSQSIFKYMMANEEEKDKNIITYSNNEDSKNNESTNKNNIEEELETDTHEYNIPTLFNKVETPSTDNNIIDNKQIITSNNSSSQITENYESKYIISDMVEQLKESLIVNTVQEDKNEVNTELETEINTEVNDDNNETVTHELINTETNSNNELFEILNNSPIKLLDTAVVENKEIDLKKKEEELLKMKLSDLKTLAKKKNISLTHSNKPKKKEQLVQNLLGHS